MFKQKDYILNDYHAKGDMKNLLHIQAIYFIVTYEFKEIWLLEI